ncbi:MAG: decarboxylating NADP(+)-dependent phosphogluconate dehydrogenase [Sphaerochaetaceae bacterium]
MKASIGLIGLAVMGENLVLNMESKGYTVAVFNRTTTKVDAFLAKRAKGKKVLGCHSLEELVDCVERPRKIMMMVKAGEAVDQMIQLLLPLLAKGDVIIDGGNSNFQDTQRRVIDVEQRGIYYIGTGVSGGEEGALKGPSLMPGGSQEGWPLVKTLFQDISAKAGDGSPCCDWIGNGGSGHFVKMVHNGIEYGDMELISEVYDLMRKLLGLDYYSMQQTFLEWNKGELNSFLIKITADILGYMDQDGTPLVEKILDVAGQKGTGKWTGIEALNEGIPLTLIVESVFARSLSSEKEQRDFASKLFPQTEKPYEGNRSEFIRNLQDALYMAKIISYAQGFELIRKAGNSFEWNLNLGNIALLWRGGCIIRSSFLEKISSAFTETPRLENLILNPFFQSEIKKRQQGLRNVVARAALQGIPVPSLSAALSWFDGYRCNNLPANLIQAQRDYFGAHTYERNDCNRGEFFHTNWTGHGGTTASTTYTA